MVFPRPLPLVLTVLLSLGTAAGAGPWTTDFEAARKQAAEEHKDLLLSFTGSDWCPGCMELKERVLTQDAFGKALAKHFVLVELDYPRDQAGLAPEVIARNARFLAHYSIEEFPTLILADEQARPYAQTTLPLYKPKEVADYVQHLLELQARRQLRDEVLAAAAKEEGVKKANALQAAIADYPDRTVDAFIAEHDPTGIARQHILMAKLMATVEIGSREDSLSLLEDIRAIAPHSEVGVEATRLRSRVEAFFAEQEPVPAQPAIPPANTGGHPPD